MKAFCLTTLVVILFVFCTTINSQLEIPQENEIEENPDATLLVPELIEKYGYPSERHNIITPDGFILEMHRIPNPGGIPVILQHGLLASSAEFVIMGPEKGLAYILHQQGYDVWMGNARGNRYSKNHQSLSDKDKEFWNFSFHEIGFYDLPAMIDHILESTDYEKIQYIGHSMGTTSFWVMCSLRPDYCKKVISMQALAPVAYLDRAKCPLLVALAPFSDSVATISKIFGLHEFLPNNNIMSIAGQALCKDEAITQSMCTNIVFLIAGYDSDQLNKTTLPVFLAHFPAGASTKQIVHFGQIRKSGKFQLYDYGLLGNMKHYGSVKVPQYDVKKVTTPVVLHYSQNDWLADSSDVLRLRDELPNVYASHIVPNSKFNHLDFLTAINVKELLYNDVIKMMKELEVKYFNN